MKLHQMGQFKERIKRLRLQETPEDVRWAENGRFWAFSVPDRGRQIFSEHGRAGEGRRFVCRAGGLRKDDLLVRNGEKWWITSIEAERPGFSEVRAAKVQIASCRADPGEDGRSFEAAVCELYIQHAELMPQRENTQTLVLVTPKCVRIVPGHLVEVSGLVYEVRIAWELGAGQNEYEIARTVDL